MREKSPIYKLLANRQVGGIPTFIGSLEKVSECIFAQVTRESPDRLRNVSLWDSYMISSLTFAIAPIIYFSTHTHAHRSFSTFNWFLSVERAACNERKRRKQFISFSYESWTLE